MVRRSNKAEFRNLLATIKLSAAAGRNLVMLPLHHSKYLPLLQSLVQAGIVLGYEQRASHLLIRLRTAHFESSNLEFRPFYDIRSIRRVQKKRTINAKNIARRRRVKGGTYQFFFASDKGITNGSVCATHYVGGIPLFEAK